MNIVEQFTSVALIGAEWIMWILVVLSLVSVTIMVERAIYFWGQRPNVEPLMTQLKGLLQNRNIEGALDVLKQTRGIAPRIAEAMLEAVQSGLSGFEEAAYSTRTIYRLRLESKLPLLGTVSNTAPFLGLLGTVIGIMRSFNDLSMNTTGGASTVMTGVTQALVTTVFGLFIAVPAVIAFNYFKSRIRAIMGDSDALVNFVVAQLSPSHESVESKE